MDPGFRIRLDMSDFIRVMLNKFKMYCLQQEPVPFSTLQTFSTSQTFEFFFDLDLKDTHYIGLNSSLISLTLKFLELVFDNYL